MIEIIKSIENIGRFASVSSGANIPLKRFTVVYGENGKGKTTLSAILKSLSKNDPAIIKNRHRLGAQNPPRAILTSSDGEHVYEKECWSVSNDSIIIFDEEFVAENVCSGIQIENDHCKNLHELIIGAHGVSLNNLLNAKVAEASELTKELRRLSKSIPGSILGNLSIEDFCRLNPIENIDQAISIAEDNMRTAESAEEVKKHPSFQEFTLPKFDAEEINAILSRGLPEIEKDAAETVRNHLNNAGPKSEKWIADGIDRLSTIAEATGRNDCPFCAQDLKPSVVIQHYQSYFSDSYKNLRKDIVDAGKNLGVNFGGDVVVAYEKAILEIKETYGFWVKFIQLPEIKFDTESTGKALNAAYNSVREALLEKHLAPFDTKPLAQTAMDAIDAYEIIRKKHEAAMQQLLQGNALIEKKKEEAGSSNIQDLANKLMQLRQTKFRHSHQYNGTCQEYIDAAKKKAAVDEERKTAREQLNNYQENIFPRYETAINKYLERFNVGYSLSSVKYRNTSFGTTCDYKVLINNVPVGLTANEGPSFKNTLSAGDRNALALAFFLASLEHEDKLKEKTIVIDDPMTSLDDHRSLATQQEVANLVKQTSQVIVFSHKKQFLCELWESMNLIQGYDPSSMASMVIEDDGGASTITEWNVDDDSFTLHDFRHNLVSEFIVGNSQNRDRDVAIALRFILESFIRIAYPESFPPRRNYTLGKFIIECQKSMGQDGEILSGGDIAELSAILEYANKFHHNTNPNYAAEEINITELKGFAKRTLAFTRRP